MDAEMTVNTLDAENAVAGSILISDKAFYRIQNKLNASMFLTDGARAVFEAATYLSANGKKIDPLAVKERISEQGGSVDNRFLADLIDVTPTSANIELYAEIVVNHAKRRSLTEIAESILTDNAKPIDQLLTETSVALEKLAESSVGNCLLSSIDLATDFYAALEDRANGQRNVVPTGFPKLDRILGGGFLNGGLYIIAARPGCGKTTIALNIADNVDGAVLFVSLEMSPEQLTAKRLARTSGIGANRLLMGNGLSDSEFQKVAYASAELAKTQVYVNKRAGATVAEIGLLARNVKGLKLLIVDYLGLIQSSTKGSRYESTTQISNDLKRLAITLGIPILALAQLNRNSEQRADKRPALSDLRDSGAIEQDADAVMLLHRPDFSESQTETLSYAPKLIECHIAKNRHAGLGTLYFNGYLANSKIVECD